MFNLRLATKNYNKVYWCNKIIHRYSRIDTIICIMHESKSHCVARGLQTVEVGRYNIIHNKSYNYLNVYVILIFMAHIYNHSYF